MNRTFHANLFAGISALLMVVLVSAATGAEAPQKPNVAPVAPHGTAASRASALVNSHLHGAKAAVGTPISKKKAEASATGTKKVTKAKPAARRWSFSEWATLHRGLGTIRGEVKSASGSPMANIRVALRSSTGKVLGKASDRHVTHTGSGGTFVMKHVRIGSFRVRATKGKAVGHVGVHVSGGRTAMAMVKL